MFRYLIPSLVLVAAMGCAGPGSRDGGPGGGERGGERGGPPGPPPAMDSAQRLEQTMKELTERLALKPEQVEQVRAIIKAGEDKKESMRPEGDRYDSREAMDKFFARMQQVDRETEEALGKVLTESQLEEYQEYIEERRKRFLQGGGPGGGPGGGRRPPGGGRPGGG